MFSFGSSNTFGSSGSGISNPNSNDKPVNGMPNDSLSQMKFSPNAAVFAAGSWNGEVRVWQMNTTLDTKGIGMYKHEGPVLDLCWNHDGSMIFSCDANKTAQVWSCQSNQKKQIAKHDAAIKCIRFCKEKNYIITGSWDRTLKYWDLRSSDPSKPIGTVQLPERVYCMDSFAERLVVGMADRKTQVFDIRNPGKALQDITDCPLRHQTRCLAIFHDKSGFAIGSIEGRCAIQNFDQNLKDKNFAFKCHRQNRDIYAVNCIVFHKTEGTFATCGADGAFNFWDKDAKQRLKAFKPCSLPIVSGDFNSTGEIFGYAVSYDWSKGASEAKKDCAIYLHKLEPKSIQKRQAGSGSR